MALTPEGRRSLQQNATRAQLNRRLFVRTAGAGLVFPFTGQLAAAPGGQKEDDRVLLHAGREMARLYTQQRSGPFYAEHYASLAANLRLMALVFPDIRALARKKPSRQRDAHAEHLTRAEEVRRHLGIDISGEPPTAPLTPDVEPTVRAHLALEGFGPTLLKMAALAETKGRDVARHGNNPHIHRVQQEWSPWCPYVPVLVTVQELVCLPVWTLIPGGQATYVSVCTVAIVTRVVWQWFC